MIFLKKLKAFSLKYYALGSSFLVLIFYCLTLAPGVIASDAGELATVQYTLGIAHPTGYPLFTILGYLFSHLPIPIRPIIKLNFLTALWSALAVYILIKSIKFILDNIKTWISESFKLDEQILVRFNVNEEAKVISAVFGGLVFGFSKTLWFQSLSVEVYTLNAFLVSIILYFLLKAFIEDQETKSHDLFKDSWFYVFLFFALGFTNHLSTLFLIPTFLYIYFYGWNINKQRTKRFFIYSLIAIVILILVYLYLPIRALMQPFLNWGNPITFQSLINHISGRLYHQFLFPSFGDYISKVGYFLNTLTIGFDENEFTGSDFSVVIVFAFLGMIVTAFLFKKVFLLLILIILSTIFISSFYNIPDIDGYYLSAHYSISIFAAFGFFYLFTIKLTQNLKRIIITLLFIVSIYVEVGYNYPRVNLNDHTLMDDYAVELLNSVDQNAIVISARSSFYFPTLYYQLVEGYRKDVVVVEHILLQQKWYYTQVNKIHPGIIKLQDTSVSLNTINRSVYFSVEMLEKSLRGEVKIPEGLQLVPDKFLFKLVPTNIYHEIDVPEYNFKFIKNNIYETGEIKNLLTNLLVNRAIYEMLHGKIDRSKLFLKKLEREFPDYILPADLEKLSRE